MTMFWQKTASMALIGMGLMLGSLTPAHSQDAYPSDAGASSTPKLLYVFSTEFPGNPTSQYPSPPLQETRFWQLLDREMKLNGNLALTENMEQADYRVDLRCAGIVNCAKLIVDIRSLDRDVLATFPIKNVRPVLGLWGWPNLESVAKKLTVKLDERLRRLEQGGYGYTEQ